MLAKHVQSLRRRDPGYAPASPSPARDQKDPGDAPPRSWSQPDLHPHLLGHADVSTTEIYAAPTGSERKAIESAYQSLTPSPYPTGQRPDLLECSTTPADSPDYVAGTTPRHATTANTQQAT